MKKTASKRPPRRNPHAQRAPQPVNTTLPETGYVRLSQLIPGILPFSDTTLWRKMKGGTFPPSVRLSERVSAWRAEDIRAWLADPVGYRAPPSKPARENAAKPAKARRTASVRAIR